MFKRLNTGGEKLSDQEIRNCTIRLLNDEFNKFLINVSLNEDFQECVGNISEEKKDQRYDQELVLRFLAFKNNRENYRHDVADFMTEYMEKTSDPDNNFGEFDFDKENEIFNKTFRILNKTLGQYIFSRTNTKGTPVSTFLVYHFEAFTLGIQKFLDNIDIEDDEILGKLEKVFWEIKNDTEFKRITTGGGKNSANPLRERIQFGEEKIEAVL